MANISITVDELNRMEPLGVVEAPAVREKFINIYNTLWGEGTGEAAYERESVYFNKLLRETENGKLLRATRFSIFTAFIDLAVCGLSLEPGARALAYLMGRNYNIGSRENPKWEGRLVLTISAYGELVLRARSGQIRHADNPVLVYEGDDFSFADRGGRKEVDYVCRLPHAGKRVIACYLRITRADGSTDYSVMTEEDWSRLAQYSARQNKNVANALYGIDAQGVCHIDTGFLMAKCIKHAFKTYPKVRIGRGTELQSQQAEEEEIKINDELYGMADPSAAAGREQPSAAIEPRQAGVTIDAGDDDGF